MVGRLRKRAANWWTLALVGLAVCLAGCAPAPMVVPTEVTIPTPTSISMPTETSAPAVTRIATLQPAPSLEMSMMERLDDEGRRWVARAREDLLGRLRISDEAVKLVRAEAMMWSDSSLGCPKPGMMYAQVITPGYQIVFEHAGKQYDYHIGNNRLVLCEAQQ